MREESKGWIIPSTSQHSRGYCSESHWQPAVYKVIVISIVQNKKPPPSHSCAKIILDNLLDEVWFLQYQHKPVYMESYLEQEFKALSTLFHLHH